MENTSNVNACGLRRRSVGQDNSGHNLPLNLQVGFKITEGGVIKGTPSPSNIKMFTDHDDDDDDDNGHKASSSRAEFRKKQQSFEIHIEDCDEEEMSGGSSDEGGSRSITPVPPQLMPDCSENITYKERAPAFREDLLQIGERDLECLTDVSEAESENEDEDQVLPENSVIKRVPSNAD